MVAQIQSSTSLLNWTSNVHFRHKQQPQVNWPQWAGLPCLSFYVTLSPSLLPFCCFPPCSSIHLYLRSCHMSCRFPVHHSPPLLSLVLSFSCWMRDILLLNTHGSSFCANALTNVCTHRNADWHTRTCTQEQEINRAFWNAKHNSTQQRRTTCCQVSTKKLKLWLAHSAFHWNLKVILFLSCWGTRVTIGATKSKNDLKKCVVYLRLIWATFFFTRGKKTWSYGDVGLQYYIPVRRHKN